MQLFHSFTAVLLLIFACNQNTKVTMDNDAQTKKTMETTIEKPSVYNFKVKDLSGNDFDFATLKGKKIMIVNTASECGLTPQYEQLQALYNKYQDANFVIIGFPANNFGAQEPGTNEEIGAFCKKNYGVTFPMMAKISVKGEDIHEIYQFLTQKSKNGFADSDVEWNFQKYLIDENGQLVNVISPRTLPNDKEIISWIEGK